ncbi:hypothetical protein MIMGU_mgv1a025241mg [Erythranthe guttata]|uniref:C3H1-type domain-containing protein n=1 Tax=Erythranthe guttata TaxID=4155 RepID=A0A022QXQ0_ERYGU|nr:hypothetical protein MIMGU_mgv1a025241mg [Erythranthe guttata]
MMDCNQGSGFADGNVVQFESGNLENDVNENPCLGSIDRAVSAIEDGIQNRETSVDINPMSNQEGTLSQFGVGSEPQNKRPRSSLMVDLMASDRSKVIKMLYKTKLCKFRNGNCLAKNCNYAHKLQRYGGGPVYGAVNDSPVLAAKASARRRLPNLIHKTGEIPSRKWSGPEKISKIYGDWIDDLQ